MLSGGLNHGFKCRVDHRDRSRARYASDPDYRERIKARSRARYQGDPETRARVLARNRAVYKANPEAWNYATGLRALRARIEQKRARIEVLELQLEEEITRRP